jgi:glycosyltransferase involved in cell wall biosynthesis
MLPTVSIILAAYNAETTIERMLQSIQSQTFSDWELVAVDDGSTDSTGKILEKYSAQDSRIRVIHKSNGGVAMARQTGMDNARGEYTIHADADDWVEPTMLEELFATAIAENADIVICDYYTDIVGKQSKRVVQRPDSLKAQDVLSSLYAKGLFGGLWHKLIKKSVYDRSAIRFTPGVNYCEDLLVLTRILTSENYTPKITYHEGSYYHYVVNNTSLTQCVTSAGFESVQRFHRYAADLLPKERFSDVIEQFAVTEFVILFTNHLYSNGAHLRDCYRRVRVQINESRPCLRWRLGFWLINIGLTSLAHRLIKF